MEPRIPGPDEPGECAYQSLHDWLTIFAGSALGLAARELIGVGVLLSYASPAKCIRIIVVKMTKNPMSSNRAIILTLPVWAATSAEA